MPSTNGGLGFSRGSMHQRLSARNSTLSGTPNWSSAGPVQPSQTAGILKSLATTDPADMAQHDLKSLSQTVTAERGAVRERLSKLTAQAEAIHQEMQVVYSKATRDLVGYATPTAAPGDVVASKGQTVALLYPMHQMKTDDTTIFLMRCKTCHEITGQLSLHWVRIMETTAATAKTVRNVGKFTVVPP